MLRESFYVAAAALLQVFLSLALSLIKPSKRPEIDLLIGGFTRLDFGVKKADSFFDEVKNCPSHC